MQASQALQVPAGAVASDAADMLAGPGVEPVGQMLGEQRASRASGQAIPAGTPAPTACRAAAQPMTASTAAA
ncbi:hypothetical protein OHA74_52560 [Streptomyces phaeochromogenes]|uniref:hypothetical protein n=1 Tax=Streptomyces phaeochromogenes TaxID=1923 RepID=UPI002E2E1C27|nr:hypothetical protein [Streptomyces phaeochromogenes]